MKLLTIALLGTLALPVFAQKKTPVPPQQVTTGNNSPNIQNISGDATITYQDKANPPTTTTTKPEPTVAELKRELAIQKVRTAVAEAQTAEASVASITAQATAAAQAKGQQAVALIEATKKELGYDDKWEWNFQVQNYVQKPQVGTPPAPAPNK